MLIYLIQTPAFKTLIVILGWIMFIILILAAIVLAALEIMMAIVRFFQRYWKPLAFISFSVIGVAVAVLLFIPIV